jgi:hypothetical protein
MLVEDTTQRQLASARCGARILHADERSGLFLISCEEYRPVPERRSFAKSNKSSKPSKPKYRFDLFLVRPGFVRSLRADTARVGVDVLGRQGQRFFPIRPGAEAALVDFAGRRLLPLPGESFVLATGSGGVLLKMNRELKWWTPRGLEPIDQKVSSLDSVLSAGPVAAVADQLYLVDDELQSRGLPANPLFVSPSGHSLIPKESGTLLRWPRGPLLLLGPPGSEPSPESPPPAPAQ